ncbi:MAG: hypothetical protein M1840_001651 [Geoglossum simile]|nr:MAG: hypothetical protein M1840_001651 [Geoglossum simile]
MSQDIVAPGLITPESRVTYDPGNKALRTWFDLSRKSASQSPFEPRDVAFQVLKNNAKLFLWNADLADLRDSRVNSNQNAHSVRFTQALNGIAVRASEVIVNMYTDGSVYSIYNNYHYVIPRGFDQGKIKVTEDQGKGLAERLLGFHKEYEIQHQALAVYRYHRVENYPPKGRGRDAREAFLREVSAQTLGADDPGSAPQEGQYFLAWDCTGVTQNPCNNWRILLDAISGRVITIIDLAQYATGSTNVFDPNPVVTTGNASLAPNTAPSILDGIAHAAVLERLNARDASGNLHLDGAFVQMAEIETPAFNEPANTTGDFRFSTADRAFLNGMCYFHIDTFQNYVQTILGLSNVANFSIAIDPQGLGEADNSHYLSGPKQITFGEGGVPDAQDAMVILHEYGHAIQDNVNPGFNNPASGVGEGFGDFLSAVFYDDKHTNPSSTRGWMMSWDARGGWPGRRYDRTFNFNDPEYTNQTDKHLTGELWCTTMFELFRKLGGDSIYTGVRYLARDLAIWLHLKANFLVPQMNATASQMGQQIEAADGNLSGWRGLADKLHQKVIYDTFRRRHLTGYPNKMVDVYINDGREGGYGSTSQNDLFTEKLWLESYWDTRDIWVKTSPYTDAATQVGGGPADHIEPPVGSNAFLYTRVKNRGSNAAGSGPVKVRVFHCSPGIGLVWPDDWVEMDASQVTQPLNILPGTGNGDIVGPFTWIPTEIGHECVLAIVECANDRAVTQDLPASAHVEHSKLVPFDNNIAQRNLVPTLAKGKTKRGFWVRNPEMVAKTVALIYDANLPDGWIFQTNLVNPSEIHLGPLGRRWVEIIIDQAKGAEVTHFNIPYTLTVIKTIEESVIGGMTFYLAPDSTFGQP